MFGARKRPHARLSEVLSIVLPTFGRIPAQIPNLQQAGPPFEAFWAKSQISDLSGYWAPNHSHLRGRYRAASYRFSGWKYVIPTCIDQNSGGVGISLKNTGVDHQIRWRSNWARPGLWLRSFEICQLFRFFIPKSPATKMVVRGLFYAFWGVKT